MSEPPHYTDSRMELHHANVLDGIPLVDGSVNCIVTSPPYLGLRDYGVAGQIGAESSPAEYVEHLRTVAAECHRVLADDGTFWLNLGDSYANATAGGAQGKTGQRAGRTFTAKTVATKALPAKNLMGMPWRVAFALQADGWILRNAIVWQKPNGMPDSAADRLSKKYEMIYLFAKSARYWFDLDPIREAYSPATESFNKMKANFAANTLRTVGGQPHRGNPGLGLNQSTNPLGKNPGDVWSMATTPFAAAHFATFPPELPRRCILAGCKPGGVVLDPFHGSGTTGMVALQNGYRYIGLDLNRDYLDLSMTTRLAPFVTAKERPA